MRHLTPRRAALAAGIAWLGACAPVDLEPGTAGVVRDPPTAPIASAGAPGPVALPDPCVADPDGIELCDGVDNDCDGIVDEWDPARLGAVYGVGAPLVPADPDDMVCVLPATFRFGPEPGEVGAMPNEFPIDATITRPFWISRFEVTQAEYGRVLGVNPTRFGPCPDCAQDNVTWDSAAIGLDLASDAAGLERCFVCADARQCDLVDDLYGCEGFRLPTEAEWELAARAPVGTMPSGDALTTAELDVGCDPNHPVAASAWFCGNSDRPQPVGLLAPSWRGLYDLSGNVWEWCADKFVLHPPGGADPLGVDTGRARVLKGGGHSSDLDNLRVARRNPASEVDANNHRGFRIVLGEPSVEVQ